MDRFLFVMIALLLVLVWVIAWTMNIGWLAIVAASLAVVNALAFLFLP